MVHKDIINCPNCNNGNIKKTNSLNFGAMGAFTFGILNILDKVMSQEWNEKCKRCDGLGKIKVTIKEE